MKIKVAMIGCGAITEKRHAPEYHMHEHVEIIAFCDPNPQRSGRLVQLYGGQAFTDYREVLKLPHLNAVSICTSNSTHAGITLEALKAGKHVLCEKPMATTLEDARIMIETAASNHKFLMIGHNQRLIDTHRQAKQIISTGKMGRILTFKTNFGHAGPEMWSADKGAHTWFFRKSLSSLGALGDLGIHKADLIRWLLGEEIDEIGAMLSTRDKRNDRNEWIEVEDNALCLLKSCSGIVGTLTASWTYYGEEDNSTILYCEKGIIRICDDPEYQLILEWKSGEREYFKAGQISTNESQGKSGIIDAFIDSIRTGTKPEICGEEGYEALNIIMSCMKSYETNSFVKVKHWLEKVAHENTHQSSI